MLTVLYWAAVTLGVILAVAAAYLFYKVGLQQLLIGLAQYDSGYIPIRIRPPEGQMFVVVEAVPEGPYAGIIESVPKFHFVSKEEGFAPDDEPQEEELGDNRTKPYSTVSTKKGGRILKLFGCDESVVWVGFNKALLFKETKYDKWEQLPNSTEWGLVSKTRRGNAIYFQYLMAAKVDAAETKGNFPVDVIVTFSARLMNPVKALFIAGSWESQTTAAVQGAVREYIARRDIDQLRQENDRNSCADLIDHILKLNENYKPDGEFEDASDRPERQGLLDLIGIEIVHATFVKFDLVTGDPEMARAAKAVEIAQREGDAAIQRAQREAEATLKKAEGEALATIERAKAELESKKLVAEGIRQEYEARNTAGEHAGTFAIAEAIREAKPQAIGGQVFSNINVKNKEDDKK